jgi:D-glycero-D-manno-heptose 1,7-bisphosphate phosphatase
MHLPGNSKSDSVKNKPVLFLDRDGVINEDKGFITKKSEIIFHPEIFDICRHFLDLNYKIVVVSNQSGIGRGVINIEDFHKLTIWMIERFSHEGIEIELFLASSLDPTRIDPPNYESFRRKPNPGLFLDAAEIMDINFNESVMIGDNLSDFEAAYAAGIGKIFLINSNLAQNQEYNVYSSHQELMINLAKLNNSKRAHEKKFIPEESSILRS